MSHGACYCRDGSVCPRHEAAPAKSKRIYVDNDYREDYVDNHFERANYPRMWDQ